MILDLKRHETIKFKLRLAGLSLSSIARDLGISQSTVTVVCQGYRKSHRVQTAIAIALDEAAEELFPERYMASEKSTDVSRLNETR